MQCRHGAGCHMRLRDGCQCVKVGLTTRAAFFAAEFVFGALILRCMFHC